MGNQNNYIVASNQRLPQIFLKQINKFSFETKGKIIVYNITDFSSTAYLFLNLINTHPDICEVDDETLAHLKEKAKLIDDPVISLADEKHIGISCPMLPFYLNLMVKIAAAQKTYTFYTVAFSRAIDVIRLLTGLHTFLPAFKTTDEVKKLMLTSPLEKNTISNLYKTDVSTLFSVHYAYKKDESNFHKAGYHYLSDLLAIRPLRYIDKTQVTNNLSWKKNDQVILIGKILNKRDIKGQHASFDVLIASQNNLKISVMFFRRYWMLNKFNIGDVVLIIGSFYYGNVISGSSMDLLVEASNIPIVPIYSQSTKNGITTRLLMSATHEILDRIKQSRNQFAPYFKNDKYLEIIRAFHELHFPTNIDNYKVALNALAFYELTYLQLIIEHKKMTTEDKAGLSKPHQVGKSYDYAIKGFPWPLTDSQKSALQQIDKRLSSKSAEQILLSADVGAGKTLIAQLTCLQAVDNGFQAVLAAPTEVLAQQLYNTFVSLLAEIPANIRPTIVYLSGKVRERNKQVIKDSIAYGDTDIIVGTHSVLSDKVNYKNLGVICIDEQQKFGSAQREELLNSRSDGKIPDLLTQTATPIPRSTAQAFYGDIDVITMKGRPNGRKPIETIWIKDDPEKVAKQKTNTIWKDVQKEAKLGHKTFVVVPMVNENPKMSVSSVNATYKALKKNFPDLDIEYAHGQMKQESQDKHINHFRKKGDILVASTIIEVGIDVPEATRMVILSADRLGASSLHQIRGRVGRNDIPSKCYLVSNNDSQQSMSRLQALVDTNNGFKIAQIDLKTRGEGDLFGIKQAGDSNFNFVSLVDNSDLIEPARNLANKIYNSKYKNLALRDAYYALSMNKKEDKS